MSQVFKVSLDELVDNDIKNITCNDYDGGRSFNKEDLRHVTEILEYLQDIDEIY